MNAKDVANVGVVFLRPTQLAWMRRPELEKDHPGMEIWEKPDGTLHPHDKKLGALLLMKPKRK